ncbi:hypothetical protein [Glaciibacter superstes]|uniref:hypothetical protein n=1 Tax=Glaciibacter superstes TaxID=501023 RepID=UPI0012F9E660|nr:hypothetical protein [Glaciibacter superstes]
MPEDVRAARDKALDEAHLNGIEAGRSMAAEETAVRLPPPKPRWDVTAAAWSATRDSVAAQAALHNRMPDSVARGVRIEPANTDGRITSSGYWEDLSGQNSGSFNVSVSGSAPEHGTPLTIEWYDESGEKHKQSVRMDPLFDVQDAPFQ